MNARLSACRPSTSSRLVENRSMTDAAGARATSTGSSVVSLTNRATWGFQKRMVAYQLPNTVVERSSREAVGCLTRSRNLRVRWTTNTDQNLAFPGRSPREHQSAFGVTMCCGRCWRWTARRPRRRGANPLCPTSSFVRDSCALAPWLAVPRARRTAAHHTAHAGCDRNTAPLTPEISRPAAHRRFTGTRDQPEEDAMAHPELKALANVLNAMPVLDESARIRQSPAPRRIVLTSSGQPDVVIETGTAGARFALVEVEDRDGPAKGDIVVATDAANRLLVLWGRRSSQRQLSIETDGVGFEAIEPVLWPAATTWPRHDSQDTA